MREVLLRLVDDSRLSEFKPEYGRNMITGWAHFYGMHRTLFILQTLIHFTLGFPVGIVANQMSVIHPTEAAKGAQFIRMCNQQ